MSIKRLLLTLCVCTITNLHAADNNTELKTISDIHNAYKNNTTTAEQLTRTYIDRINELNPKYNAVISIEPTAIEQAKQLDALFKAGKWAGPLHGIAVLLKDNIETTGTLPTTAGSLALAEPSRTPGPK